MILILIVLVISESSDPVEQQGADQVGLSTDTKPTTDLKKGDTFTETDTGSVFVWDGTVWSPLNSTIVPAPANFHKEFDPGAQEYPALTLTTIQAYTPATDYRVLSLVRWVLPSKVGNLEPVLKVIFSDDSTRLRRNTGAGTLTETRDAVEWDKDGLLVKAIEFCGDNLSATPETQDLALFKVEGDQY